MECREPGFGRLRALWPNDVWLRRGIAIWIVLTVAMAGKTLLQGDHHSVYKVFATASRNWWAGQSLYGPQEGIDIYRYSPTFSVAFTPFAVLPPRIGNLLWNTCSILLLFGSVRLLARHVFPGPWPPWREGLLLAITALLSARMVWAAQSNTLLIALIALAAVAITQERWWTAVWLLAIPVFIKLWPLAVVMLLMACWPRQLIPRFPVPVAALAAAPFLTRPFPMVVRQYQGWYASLTGQQQGRWAGFRDAWTIWEEVYPPVSQHGYLALQLAAAGLVLAWCLWQRKRTQTTGHLLTLILSMWVCWQLFLGPGTERLTYGIVAPFLGWAVATSVGREPLRYAWAVTACVVVALFSLGDIEKEVLRLVPLAKALLPTGVAIFAAWLVWFERGPVTTGIHEPTNLSPTRSSQISDQLVNAGSLP